MAKEQKPKAGAAKAAEAAAAKPQVQGNGAAKAAAQPVAGSMAGKTVSSLLGEMVWLMSQSPRHKVMMIGDLEAAVMPAILLRQFRIYYEKAPAGVLPGQAAPASAPAMNEVPIGLVIYARMGAEALARLEAGATTLRPGDWNSGPTLRILDLFAPFGGREEMEREFLGAVR